MLFIVEHVDNFVLMTLEQMREVLIEEYPDISICKTHFYPHKRKVAVGSRLFGDEMNFEMACDLSTRMVSIYILVVLEIGQK
jgi:hypothetical protein